MIISTIDGSPKLSESNSSRYLKAVTDQLSNEAQITSYKVNKSPLSKEAVQQILQSDILLLSFPLYVDGIPVNLLSQMIVLQKAYQEQPHTDTIVYVMVNNGFYEGEQNVYAIQMVKNFCKRAGIRFGQGVGIGTGEMQGGMIQGGVKVGTAVLTNLGKKLDQFIGNIRKQSSDSNLYVRPNFPWHAFKMMARITFWNAKAKSNGVTVKQLKRRRSYQHV